MMRAVLRVVGAIAGAVVLAGAIYLLREATISTHYQTDADSRLVVVVRAASNRPEEGVSLEHMASAQIELCALEVSRAGDVQVVYESDDRFVVTLTPALDSTDRKQYRGCLEDWNIDHLQLDIESLSDEPIPDPGGGGA
jgi:hypothetical protein